MTLSFCFVVADDVPSCSIVDASTRYEFPIQYTDTASSVMIGQSVVRGIAGIIESGGTMFIASIASRTVLGRTSTGMHRRCGIIAPSKISVNVLDARNQLAETIWVSVTCLSACMFCYAVPP